MSTPRSQNAQSVTLAKGAEVVAGLVNDGSAAAVARAAVDEAIWSGRPLSFLHVVRPELDVDARARAEACTFGAAMDAVAPHSAVTWTFEGVIGDPGQVLSHRTRRSAVLLVGEDRPERNATVAAYCRKHAVCPVRTVATPR